MRVSRFSSFGTLLLLSLLLPVSSQGQFGKLIHAAKSVKTSIDSAKAMVDTTKTVVSSGKAAVADATNGSLTVESATDTSKAKQAGAGAKASASGPSASAGTAGAGNKATSQPTTTAAASRSGTRARVASTTTSRPAAATAQPVITEPTYAEFARGAAVQQALLKSNPKDPSGALAAAVSASGLSRNDYAVLRVRVGLYYALAQSNSLPKATGVISAPELAVLNAHKADVMQLMQP